MHALHGTRQDLTDSLFHDLCGFHRGIPSFIPITELADHNTFELSL
jgi:hypothetical protein